MLLDNLLTAVMLLDKHLIIRYVNPAAEQLLGVSARRVVDHALEQVVDYLSLDLDRLRQCLRAGQGFTDNEVTLVVENEPRSVEVSVIAVYDHQEQLALMELRKIDQQKRINDFRQIAKIMYDETYIIPIRNDDDIYAVNNRLKNIRFSGADPFMFVYEWEIK
jgi:two-component system nitrogen regulation sensor histidine kinase GlnL